MSNPVVRVPTTDKQPMRDDALISDQDVRWIAQLQVGDERVLAEVFHMYYEPLVRFAFRSLGTIDAAEDVVQEVFARLWEQRDRLVVRTSLRSYLFGATHHRVLDVHAHDNVVARYAAHITDVQGDTATSSPAPDSTLLADELQERAERRINALPTRTQTIYRLSRDAGLSYAEIAVALHISVNTVYVLMGRALKSLRLMFEEEER